MNRYTLILTFLLTIVSFPSMVFGVDINDLVPRDGLAYEKFTDVPYTEEVTAYHKNGQLWTKATYKNSKAEGEWVFYDVYGKLSKKGIYKNGKKIND